MKTENITQTTHSCKNILKASRTVKKEKFLIMQALIRELNRETQTRITKNTNECRNLLNTNDKYINFTLTHQNIRSITAFLSKTVNLRLMNKEL